jgi:hypothetical protein
MAAIWNSPSGLKEGCAVTPSKKTMLEMAVDNYQAIEAQLSDALGRLEVKLATVSSDKPAQPTNACDNEKNISAPIIQVIDKISYATLKSRDRVQTMIDRLDI